MLICENCFADLELRSEVTNNSTSNGLCEICGCQGNICDLDYFRDFFKAILHLFEIDDNGTPVVELIQNDWNLFSKTEYGCLILTDIINNDSSSKFTINDKVNYVKLITDRVCTWEKLKKEVKEDSRFFSDIDEFKAYNVLEPTETLKKNKVLYRARVIPENLDEISPIDMGCPPKEKATAGRANPLGIPYLYLCEDIDTTYYEIRAVYLDRLAIGEFEIQRDLLIVDFHLNLNLYVAYSDGGTSLEEIIARKKVMDAISSDLSRPLRRFDSEIEYVPTQLICEYCKRITNADGICFESSLLKGHSNYVLFDQNAAKCTKVYTHEIKTIHISI